MVEDSRLGECTQTRTGAPGRQCFGSLSHWGNGTRLWDLAYLHNGAARERGIDGGESPGPRGAHKLDISEIRAHRLLDFRYSSSEVPRCERVNRGLERIECWVPLSVWRWLRPAASPWTSSLPLRVHPTDCTFACRPRVWLGPR